MNDPFTKVTIAGFLGTVGDEAVHIIAFFILKETNTGHYIARLT